MTGRRYMLNVAAILVVIVLQLALTVRALADDGLPPTEVAAEETPLPPEDPAPFEKEIIDGGPTPAPFEKEVIDGDPGGGSDGGSFVLDDINGPNTSAEDPDYGDPIWCPAGHLPSDADAADWCTPPHDTISDLISYLQANSATYNGDGTIYFLTGNYTGPESTIILDSGVLTELGALTLSGGWDLGGTNTNTGTTTFTVSLQVLWDAAVTLVDLIFDLPGVGTGGVFVNTTGDITLDNVTVTGGASGAELVNYAGTGNVSVMNSVFSNNTNTGLLIYSSGNVTIADVTASGNNNGILIDNSTGTGTVLLSGNVFANDNGWTGVDIRSAGDVTVNGLTADNNLVGANIETTSGAGNIFVSGSTFAGNDTYGLKAVSGEGNISVTNVTADGGGIAGSVGAFLKSYGGGTITVTDSAFNNAGTGLFVVGTNDVVINNVTATGNLGDGMVVESGWVFGCILPESINVTVNGGTYTDNGGYGFAVYPGPAGTLTLSGTITFLANAEGDYLLDLTKICQPPLPDEKPGKPWLTVNVTGKGDDPVSVDCELYAGVIMIFPDGKRVKMECPLDQEIVVSDVAPGALPGAAPEGVTVLNGLKLTYDDLLLLGDTWAQITFPVPEGMENKKFSIMYWDAAAGGGKGAWIEMPLSQFAGPVFPLHPDTPEDGLKVLCGVCQGKGCVSLTVNFTGTFILVAR